MDPNMLISAWDGVIQAVSHLIIYCIMFLQKPHNITQILELLAIHDPCNSEH